MLKLAGVALHLASLAHGHAPLGNLVNKGLVDVGNDTSSGDGGLDEGVELLVSPDGELEVAGSDALDLEVLAGVAGELEDLGGEVLKDGGGVDGGGGADPLAALDGGLQEPVDTTDGELEPGLGRPGLGRLLRGGGLASLSSLSSFASLAGLWRGGEVRGGGERERGSGGGGGRGEREREEREKERGERRRISKERRREMQ